MSAEVVLRVGGFYSRCGACGKNADPYEKSHDMKVMRGEGCGATFTSIASQTHYPDDMGMDDRLREMRPDLAPVLPAATTEES